MQMPAQEQQQQEQKSSHPPSSMQQPPSAQFYAHSNTQRTLSDSFGTAKAGPPSPSKMNLLPFPHNNDSPAAAPSASTSTQQPLASSSSTGNRQHSNNVAAGSTGQSATAGSSALGHSTNKHKSRTHTSSSHGHANEGANASQRFQHPQPQKPAALQGQLALTNNSNNSKNVSQQQQQFLQDQQQQQGYHEPVAPSSGRSANSKGSSTTSEFTKRKNWSQRIVEEMQDVLHVLSPSGMVLFVSPSVTDLTGHTPEDMVGRHITDFMDPQDVDHFLEEFKQSIMTDTALTTYFRLRRRAGSAASLAGPSSSISTANLSILKEEEEEDNNGMATTGDVIMSSGSADDVLLEVTGQPYYTTSPDGTKASARRRNNERRASGNRGEEDSRMDNADDSDSDGFQDNDNDSEDEDQDLTTKKDLQSSASRRNTLGAKTCKCFFAMARPYPSRNNATLDTFLELKIENEKLRTKLADIYREIEGDGAETAAMGMTIADNGSGFQLRDASGKPLQGQKPQAYFHGDPRAIEALSQGERQISGIPSRMSNIFAQQHAQAANSAVAQPQQQSQQSQQQQQYYGDESQQYSYGQSGQRQDGQYEDQQAQGGEESSPTLPGALRIDTGEGLVSSAGLIHSSSNTYGALGIGISAPARPNNNAGPASASAAAGGGGALNSAGVDDGMGGANAEDKKKKLKKQRTEEGEFVCRDCGTVDSPEWRRGPLGPKTLCNACGLRWAKKNKQQQRNSLGGHENITMPK